MDADRLISSIRQAMTGAGQPASQCPDEHDLSAYVDGTLSTGEAETLELHLADCDECLGIVGVLSRQRGEEVAVDPAPETALARARQLGKAGARRKLHMAPQWAAAATVLLAIAAVTQYSRLSGPDELRDAAPADRTTRGAAPGLPAVHVLAPAPGATVDRRRLDVRWTGIPGSAYYDVRIVSESGDVVLEQRVTGTAWQPGELLELRPGHQYFVQVEAHPTPSKTLTSNHVPFSVAE
jgi:hypothetical protein